MSGSTPCPSAVQTAPPWPRGLDKAAPLSSTRQARPSNDQTVSMGWVGRERGGGDTKAKEKRERRGGTGETSNPGSQPHCAAVQHLLLYSFANYEGDSWPPQSSPHNASRMRRDVQPGLLVWGPEFLHCFNLSQNHGGRRQVSQFPWVSVYGWSSRHIICFHASEAPVLEPDDKLWAKGGVRKRVRGGGGGQGGCRETDIKKQPTGRIPRRSALTNLISAWSQPGNHTLVRRHEWQASVADSFQQTAVTKVWSMATGKNHFLVLNTTFCLLQWENETKRIKNTNRLILTVVIPSFYLFRTNVILNKTLRYMK